MSKKILILMIAVILCFFTACTSASTKTGSSNSNNDSDSAKAAYQKITAEQAKGMINMGYTNVYDFGGIIDWPYDTVNG